MIELGIKKQVLRLKDTMWCEYMFYSLFNNELKDYLMVRWVLELIYIQQQAILQQFKYG